MEPKVAKVEIKEYYERHHRERKEKSWRPFEAYRSIQKFLNMKKGKKLLDIGCGTGYLLKTAELKGLITYGIDLSKEAVNISKTIANNSQLSIADGEKLPFCDGCFDYVTCLGTLEHFLDANKGVQEMVRVSKNSATICIMVPNINFFGWEFQNKGTRQINEFLLDLRGWSEILENNGLAIKKIYQDKWLINRTNLLEDKNPLRLLKRLFSKLRWTFLPLNLTYQFIFICGKIQQRPKIARAYIYKGKSKRKDS